MNLDQLTHPQTTWSSFIGVEQDDGTINWELDNSTTMNFNTATNSFDFSTSQVGFH